MGLCWAACAGAAPSSALSYDATPAEMEVYAAFLEQIYRPNKNDGPAARQSVILENEAVDAFQPNRRAWEGYLLRMITGPGRASDEALNDFLTRAERKIRFFSFPPLKFPLRLIRSDELNRAVSKGWEHFYSTYPGSSGFISLSAVGWGLEGGEAVFAVRKQCGKKCGYRDLVMMQKVNGEWLLIIRQPLP